MRNQPEQTSPRGGDARVSSRRPRWVLLACCLVAAALFAPPSASAKGLKNREPAQITVKNWSLPPYDVVLRIDDKKFGGRTLESETSVTWTVRPDTCPQKSTGEVRIKSARYSSAELETVVSFHIEWGPSPSNKKDCATSIRVDENADFMQIAQVSGDQIQFTIKKR
jgi:hypothetical protein